MVAGYRARHRILLPVQESNLKAWILEILKQIIWHTQQLNPGDADYF